MAARDGDAALARADRIYAVASLPRDGVARADEAVDFAAQRFKHGGHARGVVPERDDSDLEILPAARPAP